MLDGFVQGHQKHAVPAHARAATGWESSPLPAGQRIGPASGRRGQRTRLMEGLMRRGLI